MSTQPRSGAKKEPGQEAVFHTVVGPLVRSWRRSVAAWRRVEEFHQQVFDARWGHARKREAQDQQDTLRALLLTETLGVDNPVAYETLDLIPYMITDLHKWHQRMGREDFGMPGGCC